MVMNMSPKLLKSHLVSFDRYLQDLGLSKEYSLFSNPVFHKVNEVLAKKAAASADG